MIGRQHHLTPGFCHITVEEQFQPVADPGPAGQNHVEGGCGVGAGGVGGTRRVTVKRLAGRVRRGIERDGTRRQRVGGVEFEIQRAGADQASLVDRPDHQGVETIGGRRFVGVAGGHVGDDGGADLLVGCSCGIGVARQGVGEHHVGAGGALQARHPHCHIAGDLLPERGVVAQRCRDGQGLGVKFETQGRLGAFIARLVDLSACDDVDTLFEQGRCLCQGSRTAGQFHPAAQCSPAQPIGSPHGVEVSAVPRQRRHVGARCGHAVLQGGAGLRFGCGVCQQKIAGHLVRCVGRQVVGGVGLQGGRSQGQRLGGVKHEVDVAVARPQGRSGRHRFEVARLVYQARRDGVLAITPFEARGSDIQLDAGRGVGPVLKDFSILVNFVLQSLARDVKVDGIELTRLRGEKPLAGVVLEIHLRSLRQIRLRGVEFISNRRRIGHLHAALGVLETGPQAPDPVGLARVTQGIGGDEGKALVQIGWRQGIARHLDWGCIRGHGGRGAHERDAVSHLVPHRQSQG